jgi:hypothetical protein
MHSEHTLKQYRSWQKTLRRGREMVAICFKNREGRVDPLVEYVALQPHNAPVEAAAQLPDFLLRIPPAHSGGYTASRNHRYALRSATRTRRSFLGFPAEVRNMIYQLSVHYPSCSELFDSFYVQKEKQDRDKKGKGKQSLDSIARARDATIRLHTPTILILCKQITREVLPILHERVFVIDRVPPWVMGHEFPLLFTDFISNRTLQSIRHIDLRITLGEGHLGCGKVWLKLVGDLLRSLKDHSLVQFNVTFRMKRVDAYDVWYWDLLAYQDIMIKARIYCTYLNVFHRL